MILGGHPPTTIHITIVVTVYFACRLIGHRDGQTFQRACLMAGAMTVALFLAAPQILPFMDYYAQSSSPLSSVSMKRWAAHLPVASLIHFLLPNALGNPALGFEDLPNLLEWPDE